MRSDILNGLSGRFFRLQSKRYGHNDKQRAREETRGRFRELIAAGRHERQIVLALSNDRMFLAAASVSVKAQPKNNRDTNAERLGFRSGGSPCRSLKKATREIRSRRRTKPSLTPMYRPTRRRKARASRPAARSRKRPDARFGLKQILPQWPKLRAKSPLTRGP